MSKVTHAVYRSLPWITGAGLAASHTLLSSNCTVPKSGHCSTCGSCVVALGTLVSWALWKQGHNNDDDNYTHHGQVSPNKCATYSSHGKAQ